MGYRDLDTEVMVEITAAWLDPGGNRPVLERCPQTAGVLANIEAAHARLCTIQSAESDLKKQLGTLINRMARLDHQHDRKYRGSFLLLTAFAELTDRPEEIETLLGLRDLLFPAGLMGVNKSYQAEAGAAEVLEERLTEQTRASLKALTFLESNLLDQVLVVIDSARALGETLEERRQTEKALAEDHQQISPGDVMRARNTWVRTIRQVETLLDLTETLTAEELELLLRPLHDAERKARKARSTAEATLSRLDP
ncbi:MAG: hypothetical protein AAFX99_14830 [Myxococcota bacterium]